MKYAGKWRDCCYSGEFEDHEPACHAVRDAEFAEMEARVDALLDQLRDAAERLSQEHDGFCRWTNRLFPKWCYCGVSDLRAVVARHDAMRAGR